MQEDGQDRAHIRALAQLAAGHSLPAAAMCVVAHNAHRRLHGIGMHNLAGGDGVEPRRQPWQHMKELLRGGDRAGKVRDEVDELAAPAVLLGARLVLRPAEQLQRVVSASARAGRRGQLGILPHSAARQLADGEPTAQRQLEADLLLIVVQHPLPAGEPERREHLRDRLGAVLRNHADRVARQIGHARFQRQRKMPRLLLGALAAEKAVDQHGRMVWIVARVPGTPIHIRGGLIGWRPRPWKLIHGSIVTGRRGLVLPIGAGRCRHLAGPAAAAAKMNA